MSNYIPDEALIENEDISDNELAVQQRMAAIWRRLEVNYRADAENMDMTRDEHLEYEAYRTRMALETVARALAVLARK